MPSFSLKQTFMSILCIFVYLSGSLLVKVSALLLRFLGLIMGLVCYFFSLGKILY